MPDPTDPSTSIAYTAWGTRFFTEAVTAERVLGAVNVLAGQPIDVGPLGVGPGRIAKVRATGRIGTAVGERTSTSPVTFRVALPVDLEFVIDLGMDKHRFTADISVPLVLTAHARADLAIVIDVTPPTTEQVVVRLKAQGLRASITQHAANVEGELRRFAARYVAREIDKPYVARARTIDVSAAIDRALASLAPRRPDGERPVADLPDALAAEIREQEGLFTDARDWAEGSDRRS